MKKNNKKILFYLFLFLLGCGASFSLYHSSLKWEGARQVSAQALLPEWKPADVRQIRMAWRDIESNIVFENGVWVLAERDNANVSASKVASFLNALSALVPLKELEHCDQEALKTLRVVEQGEGQDIPGVVIDLKDVAGRKLFHAVLGKGHFTRKASPMPGYESDSADGRYILVRGKDARDHVFLISRLFENFHPSPQTWLDQLAMTGLDQLLSVGVSSLRDGKMKADWLLTRSSMRDSFQFLKPSDARLDLQMLKNLLDVFSRPFSADLQLRSDGVFSADLTADFILANGFSYRLSVDSKKHSGMLEIRFDSGKVMQFPQENEKQYESRVLMLQARAGYERNAFANKIFTLPEGIADLLRKLPASNPVRID